MLRQQHVASEGLPTFRGRDDERGIDLQPDPLLAFEDLLVWTDHPQSPPDSAEYLVSGLTMTAALRLSRLAS
jgi:hypothetical protein